MTSRESSVSVAVRVRPFTSLESSHVIKKREDGIFLGDGALSFASNNINKDSNDYSNRLKKFSPRGIRKIVDVVDDRMLIFDPPESNPLVNLSKNVINRRSSSSSSSASASGKSTTRFREHRFVFDKLFDEDSTQETVYHNTTRPLLDSVLDGFNSTVFAYGATGCGKTHTISGTIDQPGIIFLTMKELFEKIDQLRDEKIIDISLSYLEIYNETIRDLMEPENNSKNLNLREDSNKRVIVSNLSSHKPNSVEQVMDMIIIGNKNRTVSSTEANSTSSRSHAVLQINVMQKNRTAELIEDHTFATLSIIDLAGSERAAATKNRGERLHEGANINKSLLALGNCINALCDLRRRNHVPYRDSKLTRLLKFSLGGNCKTVMIVCISPSSHHYDETLNTLKYADRAKEIKTKVIRNQHSLDRHVGSYLKMITDQKLEIEELRKRESIKIEQSISQFKIKRERISIGILEFIDTLKQNLNTAKFEQIKKRKTLILCKRRLILQQLNELQLINFFLQKDFNFNNIHQHLLQLIEKFQNKLIELETIYDEETEIDHILNGSVNSGIKRLVELETWDDYDKLNLDTSLSLIKDSIDKTIMENSIIAYDEIINSNEFNYNLKFLMENLMDFINNNSNENKIQELQINFEKLLLNVINIDKTFEKLTNSKLQYDLKTEIKLPTSPIRKLAKSIRNSNSNLSTFNFSPGLNRINRIKTSFPNSKISKQPLSSPISLKPKTSKKVRWSVPGEGTEIDNDSSNNSNNNVNDNNLDGDDNLSDISMEDLVRNTNEINMKNVGNSSMMIDEESFDQSFDKIKKSLINKKRNSLTSKSLLSNTLSKTLPQQTSSKSSNELQTHKEEEQSNSESQSQPQQQRPQSQGLGAPIRL
ncbi:hypothetical protein WICMUC_000287 [Wickerhamomyces mucosus]|uniref:Kinesin-like protein n=1 Tax=Wickerhamomyces mucosus TaxID=1378264 RepID=A0A9P8Q0B8_9ASCO|nr:hypothetical protein WICMUC_000287 [Wickerhamomyces mucosus]